MPGASGMSLLSWLEGKADNSVLKAGLKATNELSALFLLKNDEAVALAITLLDGVLRGNRDIVSDDRSAREVFARVVDQHRASPPAALRDTAERLMRVAPKIYRDTPLEAQALRIMGGYLMSVSMEATSRNPLEFMALTNKYVDLFREASALERLNDERRKAVFGAPIG